jgi:hypothetical protein
MKARHIKIVAIFAAVSGLLLGFQNCGSSKNALDSTAEAVKVDDGRMDIIDPMPSGDLRFAESKVSLNADDTDLRASGICSPEQEGSLLSWKVLDEQGELQATGKAECSAGIFEVVVAGAQDLACGSQLSLKAFFGSKSQASVAISKDCQ